MPSITALDSGHVRVSPSCCTTPFPDAEACKSMPIMPNMAKLKKRRKKTD